MSQAWAVVGLGNPGAKYAGTRHNIGEDTIQYLVRANAARLKPSKKARCSVAEFRLGSHKVVAALPDCYMNESGGPVSSLVGFYSIPLEHLIVVHDEVDLPYGALRAKFGGGDNGHNGLKSIRKSLGTGDWYRVRMGIGRGPGRETVNHVLSRFSGHERNELPDYLATSADAAESLIETDLATTQNRFNS